MPPARRLTLRLTRFPRAFLASLQANPPGLPVAQIWLRARTADPNARSACCLRQGRSLVVGRSQPFVGHRIPSFICLDERFDPCGAGVRHGGDRGSLVTELEL